MKSKVCIALDYQGVEPPEAPVISNMVYVALQEYYQTRGETCPFIITGVRVQNEITEH